MHRSTMHLFWATITVFNLQKTHLVCKSDASKNKTKSLECEHDCRLESMDWLVNVVMWNKNELLSLIYCHQTTHEQSFESEIAQSDAQFPTEALCCMSYPSLFPWSLPVSLLSLSESKGKMPKKKTIGWHRLSVPLKTNLSYDCFLIFHSYG